MTDTKTVEKIRIAIAHLVHVNEAAGELMQAFNERGESDCEWCGEDIGLDDHDADCKLGYLYDSMEIPTVVQGRDWPDILAELELLVKERDSAKSKLAAMVEAVHDTTLRCKFACNEESNCGQCGPLFTAIKAARGAT